MDLVRPIETYALKVLARINCYLQGPCRQKQNHANRLMLPRAQPLLPKLKPKERCNG
jgi:hypothetical protein